LRAGDHVIGMDIVEENSHIFVISEKGYGKRTKVAQFTAHARGGVGIRSAVVNTKTGQLVGVASLKDDKDEQQEVIVVSSQGQTIRLGLKEIPEMSRATQGVRIMRLNDGDNVTSIAVVEKSTELEAEEEDSTETK
jgi:DNA gyrase subunit A